MQIPTTDFGTVKQNEGSPGPTPLARKPPIGGYASVKQGDALIKASRSPNNQACAKLRIQPPLFSIRDRQAETEWK